MTKTKLNIRDMTFIAFFTALTALLSQITIPIPISPVPINLALLSVFIAGGLLGAIKGGVCMVVYVLLGCMGIPVFVGFKSIGALIGHTGGYIIGYISAAVIIGLLVGNKQKPIPFIMLAMLIGLLSCYIVGSVWFMYLTKSSLISAFTMCILPFMLGDAIKITLAATIVSRLQKILNRRTI